ncbi:MAG: tetratricopeptide repeat protein, partial [Dehalococcoidia bacterium]|nr:tetratricopeptide repeat protein [Dehalococcoidia bacterium]
GVSYYFLKQYDLAIADLSIAIGRDTEYFYAYYWRGAAYVDNEQSDLAIADFNKVIQLSDSAAVTKYATERKLSKEVRERYETDSAEYTKLATKVLAIVASEYNRQGVALFSQGKNDEAIAKFSKAIQVYTNYPSAYTNRGIVYIVKTQYSTAITDFNNAIKLNPNYALAYGNRGLAYIYTANYKEAVADLDKSLEIDPEDDKAWNNRGVALEQTGDIAGAIDSYDTALKLNPGNENAHNNRQVFQRGEPPRVKSLGRISFYPPRYEKAREGTTDSPLPAPTPTSKPTPTPPLKLDTTRLFSYKVSASSRVVGNALPPWYSGKYNSHQLSMTGGTPPYVWQYFSGSGVIRPTLQTSGITFGSGGLVKGTADVLPSSSTSRKLFVTAIVTDSSRPALKVEIPLTLDIIKPGSHWVSAVPGKGMIMWQVDAETRAYSTMLPGRLEYDIDLQFEGSTGSLTLTLTTVPDWRSQYVLWEYYNGQIGEKVVRPIENVKDNGTTIEFNTEVLTDDEGTEYQIIYKYQLTPDGHLKGSYSYHIIIEKPYVPQEGGIPAPAAKSDYDWENAFDLVPAR